jgi:tRNA G18 (ribose-2'-O)-methylase SpoU
LEAKQIAVPPAMALGPVSNDNEYDLLLKIKGQVISFNKDTTLVIQSSAASSECEPVLADKDSLTSDEASSPVSEEETATSPTSTPTPTEQIPSPLSLTLSQSSTPPSSSKSQPPVWIVIEDAEEHEMMGEIVKLAWHLGADGVLYKTARTVAPNIITAKLSGGALERRPIYPVKSLIKFVQVSAPIHARSVSHLLREDH